MKLPKIKNAIGSVVIEILWQKIFDFGDRIDTW